MKFNEELEREKDKTRSLFFVKKSMQQFLQTELFLCSQNSPQNVLNEKKKVCPYAFHPIWSFEC